MAERIVAHPDRNPPGSAEVYTEMLPHVYCSLGVIQMEKGEFADAKSQLRRSLAGRRSHRTLMELLVAAAGPGVYRLLRRSKCTFGLPGLSEVPR